MGEAKGYKNIVEIAVAALAVAELVIEKGKDGYQLSDAAEIASAMLSDAELKAKIELAVAGMGEVVAEGKDLDIQEGIMMAGELLGPISSLIQKIVAK